MKKLLLFLAAMLFSSASYAYCKVPDCKCFTDKCREQRDKIREKTGWSPANQGVISEESGAVSRRLACHYKIPFTKSKTYYFKMVTFDTECRNLFQTLYVDSVKLRAVVLKDDFKSNLSEFYRPKFKSLEELDAFIKKQWGGAKPIHHKSLKSLQ